MVEEKIKFRFTADKLKLILLACLLNLILFIFDYIFYGSNFATNDDYRMNLLSSGAYTGTPEANIVFIKYGLGFLLSLLYHITTTIPWYGICMALSMFISCVVILYYLLKCFKKHNFTIFGLIFYLIFYIFVIQQTVILPQFTLISAYLAVACLFMSFFTPKDLYNAKLHILGIFILGFLSANYRDKVFLMILPMIIIVILYRIYRSDQKKIMMMVLPIFILIFSYALTIGINIAGTSSAEYREYDKFNKTRSKIYDYESQPNWDVNFQKYEDLQIDKATASAIDARYLDIDPTINSDTYNKLINYSNAKKETQSLTQRVSDVIVNLVDHFFDKSLIYMTLYVIGISIMTLIISLISRAICGIFVIFSATALSFVEIFILGFEGRIMPRIVNVLLLSCGAVILICLCENVLNFRELITLVRGMRFNKKLKFINKTLGTCLAGSLIIITVILLAVNQNSIKTSSENQNTINNRLLILNSYAEKRPDTFFYYDSYDFIAASSPLFKTYKHIVNTDSMGNWTIKSPMYSKRNAKFGFRNSIDALTNRDYSKNYYFVSIFEAKNGIKQILQDRYSQELELVDNLETNSFNLNIYQTKDIA